jgi:hypothetical protein
MVGLHISATVTDFTFLQKGQVVVCIIASDHDASVVEEREKDIGKKQN